MFAKTDSDTVTVTMSTQNAADIMELLGRIIDNTEREAVSSLYNRLADLELPDANITVGVVHTPDAYLDDEIDEYALCVEDADGV